MNRSDIDRLRDARDNAGGLSAGTLTFTIQSQHAALYDLVVIGETLNKVSSEIKSTAPDLRWRPINDLRNIIVHSYWQIDLEIIAAPSRVRSGARAWRARPRSGAKSCALGRCR